MGIISGAVTGMTVTKGAATNNEIPITITITDKATWWHWRVVWHTDCSNYLLPYQLPCILLGVKLILVLLVRPGANGADAILQ